MNKYSVFPIIVISFCLPRLILADGLTHSQRQQVGPGTANTSAPLPLLIPRPKQATFTGKTIPAQRIHLVTEKFPKTAARLTQLLKYQGIKIDPRNGLKIQLKQNDKLTRQGYTLTLNPKSVTLQASTPTGITHAIHTLLRLLTARSGKRVVPEGQITDAPAMKMRGVFLNLRNVVATDPQSIVNLKTLFDTLAQLKINTLFLEFADNIKYQSVPFPSSAKRAFTKSQINELVQYAHSLHLKIIPYFQYLSHTPWILSNPENVALLENPKNRGWNTAWCPSNPETKAFFEAILTETIEMFQPEYIHVAMDEVSYGPFHHCDQCKTQNPSELFKKAILQVHDFLKKRSVRMMMYQDQLLYSPNRYVRTNKTFGWKIIDSLPKDIIINIWDYSTDRKEMKRQINYFTTKGFDVMGACFFKPENIKMMSEAYSDHPKSLGLLATYWYLAGNWSKFEISPQAAAITTLVAAYSWNPDQTLNADSTFDPVAEFGTRFIGIPQNFSDLDQKPLIFSGNRPFGNRFGYWPGHPLTRPLSPLPTIISNGDIQFNLCPSGRLLTISGLEGDGFPLQTREININLKAKYLAFVHACSIPMNILKLNYLFGYLKNPLIGHYRIQYKNGKTVDIPLKYRWNITDWNSQLSPLSGRTIYVDTAPKDIRVQLSSYVWTNPFPDQIIETLKLSAKGYEGVNIACMAVTALSTSQKPLVMDDFTYSSIEEFKKKWQPTLPKSNGGEKSIQFEHGDQTRGSALVLSAPAHATLDRMILDKNIALGKDLLFSRNLTFIVQSKTPVQMGVYLGDGSADWKNYRVQYLRIKKGENRIAIMPKALTPEKGKLKWDNVKKFRISFFLRKTMPTTLKIYKIQWVDNHLPTKLNRGSWSQTVFDHD